MNPKIKILKRELPHGAAKEIEKRMEGKYSYHIITRIIRGEYYKQDVIDCAIAYLEELKSKERELAQITNTKVRSVLAS